jgi:hypothetical protein
MQLDVTQSMLPIRSRPSEGCMSSLSRSFLGLFSSNLFSTSMYVHYTLRGVLPFVQLYSEVKIMTMRMISEDDQDDRGKYR